MPIFAQIDPLWLFMAGCAVLSWVLLRRYFGRMGRRDRRKVVDPLEHVHRPTSAWDGAQHDASAMIDRRQVELYDMARDVTARIDSKIILLQQLLVESERQIARMESLVEQLEAAGAAR